MLIVLVLVLISIGFLKCSAVPEPVSIGIGTDPKLPEPEKQLLPTINIATAQSWPQGTKPTPSDGLSVQEFAGDLDHPRWIYVLPNGDVLVAESNSPKGLSGIKGIKGFIAKRVIKKSGAGTPSANRITLFRDADKDGIAEIRSVFLENLYSPFGMSLINNTLYIANADGIVTVPYVNGDLKGSNSNIGENGMDIEQGRAAIWEIDVASGEGEVFGSGLRNPVGMDFGPDGRTLYTVVNERDELGDNLVPDYLTSVVEDGFYGWPYSYFGSILDARVKPQKPELVAKAV